MVNRILQRNLMLSGRIFKTLERKIDTIIPFRLPFNDNLNPNFIDGYLGHLVDSAKHQLVQENTDYLLKNFNNWGMVFKSLRKKSLFEIQ